MAKYMVKPVVIEAFKITRLGANHGYFQIENESVVHIDAEGKVGDFVSYKNGVPFEIISGSDFDDVAMQLPDNADPVYLESLIQEEDFIETGDLTVCVITLRDGRKVSGEDNAITADREERRELAYHSAFNKLMGHEMFALQGMLAMCKDGK